MMAKIPIPINEYRYRYRYRYLSEWIVVLAFFTFFFDYSDKMRVKYALFGGETSHIVDDRSPHHRKRKDMEEISVDLRGSKNGGKIMPHRRVNLLFLFILVSVANSQWNGINNSHSGSRFAGISKLRSVLFMCVLLSVVVQSSGFLLHSNFRKTIRVVYPCLQLLSLMFFHRYLPRNLL
jgi:hypothetical protein